MMEISACRFDKVVSLGAVCSVAEQVRRCFPNQQEAYPFDWLITHQRGLVGLFQSGFQDFLSPGRYEQIGGDPHHAHVTTLDGLVTILHDFPPQCTETAASQVRAKYDFLFNRLKSLMTSNQRILFVRTDTLGANQLEEVRDRYPDFGPYLVHVIAQAYPDLDFSLLFVNTGPLRHVLTEGRLTVWNIPDGSDWTGDEAGWSFVLEAVTQGKPARALPFP